ncbi:MAG TPA: fibronectin type III domain-containing protein [Nitrospiria bacterium]|nr:fibronectin type III domain-containing protein [Nitrospiria bacterium]
MNIRWHNHQRIASTLLCAVYGPPAARLFLSLATAACLQFSASFAYSADWEMRLSASLPYTTAEGGRATQSVTVGANSAAQDAFDNVSDTKALGIGVVTAYAYHPELASGDQFLARDIRADHYPQTWTINVASNQDGRPVTLTWTLPAGKPGNCQSVRLSLTDASTGATVDLLRPPYSYTNASAAPHRFILTASQATQTPPETPLNLHGPRTGAEAIQLNWSRVRDPSVVGYQLYRMNPGATGFVRRTAVPLSSTSVTDTGLVPGSYAYFVTAVTSAGCESGPSNTLAVTIGPSRTFSLPPGDCFRHGHRGFPGECGAAE